MTKVTIDRELLERCLPFLSDTPDLVQIGAEELAGELRAILAQPAAPADGEAFCNGHCTWLDHHPDCVRATPADGEAVEVVAYMDHHDTLSHDAPRTAHFALMTVAQHQRIVAKLREELEILHRQLDKFRSQSHGIPALAEHERLHEQIAQRDAKLAVVVEALRGMLEYFPEGASDGECFSVETARAALAAAGVGDE